MSEIDKLTILSNQSKLLSKVKKYIDEFLNPYKPTYISDNTVKEILNSLDITED